MTTLKVGILGMQGDIEEHEKAVMQACNKIGIGYTIIRVKKGESLKDIDCIIIPGGESTVIGGLVLKSGIFPELKKRINEGLPVFGTCAGLILLAKKVKDKVLGNICQQTLGVLDAEVERNHFGRQRESFETLLKITLIGEEPFRAIFIRSPVITSVWNNTEVIATLENKIVFVRENNILAASFHPELTGDTRIHEFFLKLCY
ncbi:MAG: pyridoxal 5'-phosphate synthase glutaminase subunit PdxT [Crenarchaeota archaeon]|nr:pyridoxal 5'-phosphate synthase glutaminase subunit PdxT [Thermoproteota archaeon]MDW8034640.1 pyridoxal 5'-phosphate synthase glutaminase subunit PdxT [Nitrososphaerota archaeon]